MITLKCVAGGAWLVVSIFVLIDAYGLSVILAPQIIVTVISVGVLLVPPAAESHCRFVARVVLSVMSWVTHAIALLLTVHQLIFSVEHIAAFLGVSLLGLLPAMGLVLALATHAERWDS